MDTVACYFSILIVLPFGYLDETKLFTMSQACKTCSWPISRSEAALQIAEQTSTVCLFGNHHGSRGVKQPTESRVLKCITCG